LIVKSGFKLKPNVYNGQYHIVYIYLLMEWAYCICWRKFFLLQSLILQSTWMYK